MSNAALAALILLAALGLAIASHVRYRRAGRPSVSAWMGRPIK